MQTTSKTSLEETLIERIATSPNVHIALFDLTVESDPLNIINTYVEIYDLVSTMEIHLTTTNFIHLIKSLNSYLRLSPKNLTSTTSMTYMGIRIYANRLLDTKRSNLIVTKIDQEFINI